MAEWSKASSFHAKGRGFDPRDRRCHFFYVFAPECSVYWQISDTKNDALDLQVMYLYKIRTNIISQKDDDDEEAIDLKKDLSSVY